MIISYVDVVGHNTHWPLRLHDMICSVSVHCIPVESNPNIPGMLVLEVHTAVECCTNCLASIPVVMSISENKTNNWLVSG